MNLAEIILVSRPSPYLFAQQNWRRPGTITTSQTGNGGLGFVLMATCPCSMRPVQQGIKQWHKWNHYACMSTERNGKSSWLKATGFQSTVTCKYATPTGHLNLHFALFVVSYEFFRRGNQSQLDCFSIKHNTSYFQKKSYQVALFRSSWHMLPYIVHVTSLQNILKFAESALLKDF